MSGSGKKGKHGNLPPTMPEAPKGARKRKQSTPVKAENGKFKRREDEEYGGNFACLAEVVVPEVTSAPVPAYSPEVVPAPVPSTSMPEVSESVGAAAFTTFMLQDTDNPVKLSVDCPVTIKLRLRGKDVILGTLTPSQEDVTKGKLPTEKMQEFVDRWAAVNLTRGRENGVSSLEQPPVTSNVHARPTSSKTTSSSAFNQELCTLSELLSRPSSTVISSSLKPCATTISSKLKPAVVNTFTMAKIDESMMRSSPESEPASINFGKDNVKTEQDSDSAMDLTLSLPSDLTNPQEPEDPAPMPSTSGASIQDSNTTSRGEEMNPGPSSNGGADSHPQAASGLEVNHEVSDETTDEYLGEYARLVDLYTPPKEGFKVLKRFEMRGQKIETVAISKQLLEATPPPPPIGSAYEAISSIILSRNVLITAYQRIINGIRSQDIKIHIKDHPKNVDSRMGDEGVVLDNSGVERLLYIQRKVKPLIMCMKQPGGTLQIHYEQRIAPRIFFRLSTDFMNYPVQIRRTIYTHKHGPMDTMLGYRFTLEEWDRFLKLSDLYTTLIRTFQP